MIPHSGKVMRQCVRLSKSRMQFVRGAIKEDKLSTKLSSLGVNQESSQQSNYSSDPHPQQPSRQYISTLVTRSPQSSSVVIKPAIPVDEKLLLKEERERQAIARTESNARFKEYLAKLPPLSYPGHYKVDCVSTIEDINKNLEKLLMEDTDKVFGVDLEWPPCFIKGQKENKVTLVQICSADKILLIQVARLPGGFPPQLREFFEDKTILKSGVNIAADGLKLHRDFGFITNGLLELRDLAETTKSPKLDFSHLRSLRALTGLFLEQNMAKGKVRLSNWAVSKLSPLQIKYAALDAYASYKLYVVLSELRDTTKKIDIKHLIDQGLSATTPDKNAKKGQQQKSTKSGNFSPPMSTVTIIRKKQ